MKTGFEDFDNERKKMHEDVNDYRMKMIKKIKDNRELIKENRGRYVYKKRLFIVRWYEKTVKFLKHSFYKLIRKIFNYK